MDDYKHVYFFLRFFFFPPPLPDLLNVAVGAAATAGGAVAPATPPPVAFPGTADSAPADTLAGDGSAGALVDVAPLEAPEAAEEAWPGAADAAACCPAAAMGFAAGFAPPLPAADLALMASIAFRTCRWCIMVPHVTCRGVE